MKLQQFHMLGIFLICFTTMAGAQEPQSQPERGSVLPGFIVTLKGDTVRGYLLNINLWMNQHITFFYKNPDDREGRIKYKPKEIKAYQVGSRYYESMKYPFTYSISQYNFILKKLDGPIDYYVWYYDQDRAKLMSPDISLADLSKAYLFDEKDLWSDEFGRKENGEFSNISDLKFLMKFAKNMSAYVKDDLPLAAKILVKEKGYQNIDIENIIREYNADKGKD